jgi:hypothetical protein
MNTKDLKVGQILVDNDPRSQGRRLTITEILPNSIKARDQSGRIRRYAASRIYADRKPRKIGLSVLGAKAPRYFRLKGGFYDGANAMEWDGSRMWSHSTTGRRTVAWHHSLEEAERRVKEGLWEELPELPDASKREEEKCPKTLDDLNEREINLLLHFEDCAVNHGGTVDDRSMSVEDRTIAIIWHCLKFLEYGPLPTPQIKDGRSRWCYLSERAWALATQARRRRAEAVWQARQWDDKPLAFKAIQ